jgi:ADP-heptose:LPS heptosyltransferase
MISFKQTYTLPFKSQIPTFIENFLSEKILIRQKVKYLRRYFFIYLKGQHTHELNLILPQHKNILWINISAPSFGDSLMDLSSRILLEDKKLDLFTDAKNANLYSDDSCFLNVYSDSKQVEKKSYDLIIIDSYSSRSIRSKCYLSKSTPFVSMFGYFNGPEVNRVLFSFHQMNHLLDYKYSENEINKIAKASISINKRDKDFVQKVDLPPSFISIVIGGEWAYRTYNKWHLVVKKIIKNDIDINIILVGSDNGKDAADQIEKTFIKYKIYNYVGKFTFSQTAEIINKSEVLFCCDGGLMHAANSVNTPIITLFARLTSAMQLTNSISAFSLYDIENVNNISVEQVINQYEKYKLLVN